MSRGGGGREGRIYIIPSTDLLEKTPSPSSTSTLFSVLKNAMPESHKMTRPFGGREALVYYFPLPLDTSIAIYIYILECYCKRVINYESLKSVDCQVRPKSNALL